MMIYAFVKLSGWVFRIDEIVRYQPVPKHDVVGKSDVILRDGHVIVSEDLEQISKMISLAQLNALAISEVIKRGVREGQQTDKGWELAIKAGCEYLRPITLKDIEEMEI